MHTLGHPCRIKEIREICDDFGLILVEDAAESLGSQLDGKHTGLFGDFGILSFNGNKIITTGGGGMMITKEEKLFKTAKHLTTTAKVSHPWEFVHDQIGYNFRLPNLNAALGVAQMEQIDYFVRNKRELAATYQQFFTELGIKFIKEPKNAASNYWLNAIKLNDKKERDAFLAYSNDNGIMTRCLWTPMHLLPMYQYCQVDSLKNTQHLYDRVVNIPSSVRF